MPCPEMSDLKVPTYNGLSYYHTKVPIKPHPNTELASISRRIL